MKYKATVGMSTCRLGGIDIFIDTLTQQTEKNFEVVLIDEWYNERKSQIQNFIDDTGFEQPVKHFPPINNYDYRAIPHGFNSCIAHAEGEIFCFLNDFTWVDKRFVERHYYIGHKYGSAVTGLAWDMGSVDFLKTKPYDKEEDLYISVFPERMTLKDVLKIPVHWTGNRNRMEEVENSVYTNKPNWWYMGKNDSMPLETLIEINGVDEHMNGMATYMDTELGVRAYAHGLKFLKDISITNYEIRHGHTEDNAIPRKNFPVINEDDAGYFYPRIKGLRDGSVSTDDTGFDMKKVREELGYE